MATIPETPVVLRDGCVTDIDAIQKSYFWKINNFSLYDSQRITTPRINFEGRMGRWTFILYPFGRDDESSEFVSVYLKLEQSEQPVALRLVISILNDQNERIIVHDAGNRIMSVERKWGVTKFIKRADLLNRSRGILTNDVLSLFFEVYFPVEVTSVAYFVQPIETSQAHSSRTQIDNDPDARPDQVVCKDDSDSIVTDEPSRA